MYVWAISQILKQKPINVQTMLSIICREGSDGDVNGTREENDLHQLVLLLRTHWRTMRGCKWWNRSCCRTSRLRETEVCCERERRLRKKYKLENDYIGGDLLLCIYKNLLVVASQKLSLVSEFNVSTWLLADGTNSRTIRKFAQTRKW